MSEEGSEDIKILKNESEMQNDEILPGYSTVENFTKDGFKILMQAIKNSNALPNGRDWNFYNTHDAFKKIVEQEGSNILQQINNILRSNEINDSIFSRSLDEKTELMIEANDTILERVANNIDELNGIRKITAEPILIQAVSAQIPINGSWNRVNNATFSVSSSMTSESLKKNGNAIRLLTAKNVIRPQKFFKDKIINDSKYPWEPRIKDKPNSLKPLSIFLEETENGEEFSHPYEFELDKFTPSQDQLKKDTPLKPLKLEDTPLIEINSPDQIDELVEVLRNCKVFAVDLEHHSYRSFMGLTCLMQISTSEKDYLIDTLTLRDKLHVLNEVFTKPTIVKIFHGADMDIKWLQRDLSIYVVNMFDTYQAAKQLGYSGLSLAYLMQRFCNFVPNKQFQLADWRIRPLPDELKSYAREDTHYLIYIYKTLKNELLAKANGKDNLLISVINNSTKICQKRYFKPVLREDSYLDFYRKCKRLFDNRQLYALRELYKWRDNISREEDESTGYVLPNHMLLQISETLPREVQGILACCNPIPPLVRANLLTLHEIILKAKDQPLEKPILKEDTRARGTTLKISKINVDSPLYCPHDLTKSSEFRDDLPTLIGNNSSVNLIDLLDKELEIENTKSSSVIFNLLDNSRREEKAVISKKIHNVTFLGPFERYKLVKPFIQAEEERLASEKSKKDEKMKGTAEVDNRTDEERIESIREHFLNLARKSAPADMQFTQPLTQMGGSKKRKREPSPECSTSNPSPINLQTTIPNLHTANLNVRKRKSGDLLDDSSPNKIKKSNKQPKTFPKNNKKNKGKNRNTFIQNPLNCDSQQNRQRRMPNPNSDEYIVENNRTEHQQPTQEEASFHIDQRGSQNKKFRNGNNWKGNFKGKQKAKQNFKNRPKKPETQNQEFAPYDYTSVDFRQFQGGAEVSQKQRQFKSSFKFKANKKNKGNNNNRSTTFGNGKKGR